MLHPYHERVRRRIAKYNIQQSLKTMVDSFQDRGYKILCTYQDSYFVKKEFYHLFDVSDDLLTLYFDGLRSISRRMPFIQEYVGKVGLNNSIVDHILEKSNYGKYGWDNRKVWAFQQSATINKEIGELEQIEKEKFLDS